MTRPENPHRRQTFVQFLDAPVSDDTYASVIAALRELPVNNLYGGVRWHAVLLILADLPEGLETLRRIAFENRYPASGPISASNLKATYISDEEFVTGGRAFLLFNLVASNWTHLSQVADRAARGNRTTP